MSEYPKGLNRNVKSCFSFVFLLLFSTLGTLNLAPNVEASTGGNLGIIDSDNPLPDTWIAPYDSILFTAVVENFYQTPSQNRVISWYVCEGVNPSNVCISSSVDDGTITINQLLPGTVDQFTSNQYFNPSGYDGLMTVVYQFDQFDLNPSNDVFKFTINSTFEYTDVKVDGSVDILQQINDLAIYDGNLILNSNTSYNFDFHGFAHLCPSCELNATFGWELRSMTNPHDMTSAFTNFSSFPKSGYYRHFTTDLPTFTHNNTGQFLLMYGMFNSNGVPNDDLYSNNNLFTINLYINDDLDLQINSMYPSHDSTSQSYYFGENMVTSHIVNQGNKTINNATVLMEIFDSSESFIDSDTCLTGKLIPNQQTICRFDISTNGNSVSINISIPSIVNEGIDINLENNFIEETTDVIIPSLSGYIVNNNQKEWYTNEDLISLTGNANLYAPGPINYSWWYSGIINLGYDKVLNLNASDLGLGEHMLRLTVTDIFGNTENIYYSVNVYYFVEIDNSPQYIASSVTIEEATIQYQSMLPLSGESYGVGNGKSPLLLVSFDLQSLDTSKNPFTGTNWMDIELNTSGIIPSSIPFETLEIRKLDSLNDTTWDFFDQSNVDYDLESANISIKIFEQSTILLIGEMEQPNVEAKNFSVSLIADGKFRLDWNSVGEIDNDYISGWNIYQKPVASSGGTVFPSSNEVFNQLVWDDLTEDTFRTFLPISTENWNDNILLADDQCSSYAIIPVDRQGVIYHELANVTTDENGDGTFICGDDLPPSSTVIEMVSSWEFTNSSDCFKIENLWSMCYSVNISWIWPEHELDGNVSWNLYRIEQNPQAIDMSLINPIYTYVDVLPSESGYYTENGWDENGIRPERTYYYILTPIDWVGNEAKIVSYPSDNIIRVEIDDDWWSYYQHLIPEPPAPEEPPLGNEWLGNVSESLELEEFRLAGLVSLIVLCLSFIMLPLIIKKRKRLKRIVDARNRQMRADSMADEFDDFFD